jgi:metallo-beta-lactamase family protein
VLWYLSALVDAGRLDRQAVFLDSPMAIDATDLYDRAEAEHDEDLLEVTRSGSDPLAPTRFQRCNTIDQSKLLNARQEPAILVASSGMATGGRVLHHLLHRLPDPRSSIVFVGFQAAGTRGRSLVDGAETVAIHGQEVRVRAQIHQIQGMSAHADRDELLRWCQALPGRPERIFLNHGEDGPRKALRVTLGSLDGWPLAHLPLTGERVPW